MLTGVLLFVVLFYVYPLKFVFTLVVNQLIGDGARAPTRHGAPVLLASRSARLMQIYSGGVVAVFSIFALMYANAFRQRERLGLDARQQLEARLNIIDNAGIALIGVASVLVATFGGPLAAAAIAGPMYFLIGPFKWGLGWYSANAYKRLERQSSRVLGLRVLRGLGFEPPRTPEP